MPTESGLYWDTCVSFTMLALFLANYLKVADYYIVMLVTKTLLQIEVVVVVVVIVLKWKYVMSNSCRLSGTLVLESRVTDDCDMYAIWFSETKVNSTQVTSSFRG